MHRPYRTPALLASALVGLAVLIAPESVRSDSKDLSGSAITNHSGRSRYLTGLQHPGARRGRLARTAGMESFGASTLALQNRSSHVNDVDVDLKKLGDPDLHLTRELGSLDASVIEIASEPSVGVGFYSAVVNASEPLEVIATTEWYTGAAAAYETLVASRELVLPLLMRDVHGHATIFRVVNTDHSDEENFMTVSVYGNETGAQLTEVSTLMPPGGTLLYDSMFESAFRNLPENAGGGYIGSIRITADKPVAVMANGDEVLGDGASAYVARPATSAAAEQYLPLVRANYLGDTLIALTNPSRTHAVTADIDYRMRVEGKDGDEVRVSQRVELEPMGSAFIDLADRGRGLAAPPELIDRRRDNTGYVGSVVIRANRPVLALAHEEANGRGGVRAVSAYNAFGPDDLDTSFAVPRVRNEPNEAVTQVALMNPGRRAASVTLSWHGADGTTRAEMQREVGPGDSALVTTQPGVPDGSHLDVRSDEKIAVLVNETAVLSEEDWGSWGRDTTIYSAVPLGVEVPLTPTDSPSTTSTPTATRPSTAVPEPATVTPTQPEATSASLGRVWLPAAWRPRAAD